MRLLEAWATISLTRCWICALRPSFCAETAQYFGSCAPNFLRKLAFETTRTETSAIGLGKFRSSSFSCAARLTSRALPHFFFQSACLRKLLPANVQSAAATWLFQHLLSRRTPFSTADAARVPSTLATTALPRRRCPVSPFCKRITTPP